MAYNDKKHIMLYATQEEYDTIKEAAGDKGMNRYILDIIVGEQVKPSPIVGLVPPQPRPSSLVPPKQAS